MSGWSKPASSAFWSSLERGVLLAAERERTGLVVERRPDPVAAVRRGLEGLRRLVVEVGAQKLASHVEPGLAALSARGRRACSYRAEARRSSAFSPFDLASRAADLISAQRGSEWRLSRSSSLFRYAGELEALLHRLVQPLERLVLVPEQGIAARDVVARRVLAIAVLDRLLKRLDRLLVLAAGGGAAFRGRTSRCRPAGSCASWKRRRSPWSAAAPTDVSRRQMAGRLSPPGSAGVLGLVRRRRRRGRSRRRAWPRSRRVVSRVLVAVRSTRSGRVLPSSSSSRVQVDGSCAAAAATVVGRGTGPKRGRRGGSRTTTAAPAATSPAIAHRPPEAAPDPATARGSRIARSRASKW